MILDSSAIVAIVRDEALATALSRIVRDASTVCVGAPTAVESGLVLLRRLGLPGRSLLARFLEEAEVEVLPFTDAHWTYALDGFYRYGKGRHPAALNLGDCFTYATARIANQPLLCVGDDFAQTDLELVAL